jgi:hypothetical protein
VQRSTADVEILAVAAVQNCIRRDVDEETETRDHEHQPALDRDRRQQAADRLDRNPAHDRDQRDAIDERRQHLEAVVAVGAARVVLPPADPERGPGERQRGGVGQHVAGVREQRQRARGDPPHDLGDHEDRSQNQR